MARKKWHYTNTQKGDLKYNFQRKGLQEHYVTEKTPEFVLFFKNFTKPFGKRCEAFKYLIYLFGDVYQHFHFVNSRDFGGNETKLLFLRNPNNLHALCGVGFPRQD